ncbi:hypothetical protein [Azospirillum sp. TSH64]|uniref:hypothetical protein n=1 Tax=Azospirillum sp. TSH64 TaxID=652740 RepID=UPI000D60F51F|nr:hypothetical protein [Azospirillum sp. TSH64]PWC81249.1 hypothetical protein TSH64_00975 [Azospirillum sp. TSH64]
MANIKANNSGVVQGAFLIPANVPAGTKRITLRGAGGSFGQAAFTGRGQITTETRRRVVTIEEYHVDPLAQTFTLAEGRHLAGAEVWFTAKGSKPVYVQIRGTATGLPTSEVIAQGVIAPADIKLGGVATRCTFNPVWIEPNREYALVILTDDDAHALAIAELGKYDPVSGWITAQPYQVGVLLSSSNASTWTPHQDKDLAFRLLAAKFNAATRTINLGTISATDATDIIAAASVERPAADCNVEFVFTRADGSQIRAADGQVVSLAEKLNGNLTVTAVLKGSAYRSPVLYPGVQPILGKLKESATYISRAIPAGTNVKVAVTLDTFTPGTSTIVVEAEDDAGAWHPIPLASGSSVGDGWEERTFVLTPFTAQDVRIRLTLNGTALYRPKARKLRVVVT